MSCKFIPSVFSLRFGFRKINKGLPQQALTLFCFVAAVFKKDNLFGLLNFFWSRLNCLLGVCLLLDSIPCVFSYHCLSSKGWSIFGLPQVAKSCCSRDFPPAWLSFVLLGFGYYDSSLALSGGWSFCIVEMCDLFCHMIGIPCARMPWGRIMFWSRV